MFQASSGVAIFDVRYIEIIDGNPLKLLSSHSGNLEFCCCKYSFLLIFYKIRDGLWESTRVLKWPEGHVKANGSTSFPVPCVCDWALCSHPFRKCPNQFIKLKIPARGTFCCIPLFCQNRNLLVVKHEQMVAAGIDIFVKSGFHMMMWYLVKTCKKNHSYWLFMKCLWFVEAWVWFVDVWPSKISWATCGLQWLKQMPEWYCAVSSQLTCVRVRGHNCQTDGRLEGFMDRKRLL